MYNDKSLVIHSFTDQNDWRCYFLAQYVLYAPQEGGA